MKYILTLILFLGLGLVQAQEIPVDAGQQEIVFTNVNVLPMDREVILANQTVVVKNGKIMAVSPAAKARYSKSAVVINGQGKYLLPGLAEMHAHVPPQNEIEPMQEVLTLFLANGITTIRGMLGHPRHLELRSKIRSGEILGPNFYTTGPSFSGQSVKTPAEAVALVRQQKEAGYDYLKLHPGLNLETFEAMARTAKEVNIPFVGHVSTAVGVQRAIAAGYSSIDHLDGFIQGLLPERQNRSDQETGLFGLFIAQEADTTKIPELMRALKAKNIWVVPTQALAERWLSNPAPEVFAQAPEMVYMAQEVRNNWVNSKKNIQANPQYSAAKTNSFIQLRRQLILACQKNGVGLLLGCDAPQVFNVPGFSTHQELQYLVAAGLTPYQALRTGTVNVATYLNKVNTAGVIRPGAVSDLILLTANPLTDIKNSQKIEGVMIGKKWLPKAYLDKELKKLVKP